MLIQVDVDSTLYDADKLFGDLAEEAGVKWPRRDNEWKPASELRTFDGKEVKLSTLKNIFRKAHSREYVSQQKPYKNAANVLAEIAGGWEEIEIAYVSDRNEAQSAALSEWLQVNDFLHDEDQHVVVSKDKRQWMREHRPSIVIDDRVRTLIMARFELNALGVSLAHNHNRNLRNEVDGIYIVKDWNEIGELLTTDLIPNLLGRSLSREHEVIV